VEPGELEALRGVVAGALSGAPGRAYGA
jgi:hypothetical protein